MDNSASIRRHINGSAKPVKPQVLAPGLALAVEVNLRLPYNRKMTEALLNFAGVRRITRLSRGQVMRLMKCGLFPQPAQLNVEHTLWRATDVRDWMSARQASEGSVTGNPRD